MTDTRDITATSLVCDEHCGFLLQPGSELDWLLRPWRDAGVGTLFINVCYDPQPWVSAVENIATLRYRLPEVADELVKVGFDERGIETVIGGNLKRVAGQVWG